LVDEAGTSFTKASTCVKARSIVLDCDMALPTSLLACTIRLGSSHAATALIRVRKAVSRGSGASEPGNSASTTFAHVASIHSSTAAIT
jgi:hypothetical protein